MPVSVRPATCFGQRGPAGKDPDAAAVVFDIEGAQNSHYRTSGMSVQTATNIVTAFCDTIENAGYDTMLYSYCKFLVEQLDLSQLQQYDLWLAQYYHVPFFPYNFQIWQYDYEGQVAAAHP